MKLMKRKKIYIPLFIVAAVVILIFILLFNNFIISTRIYYNVAYQGDIQELESLIDKSELFSYEKYCKYRGYSGEVENITEGIHSKHLDREYIESLKEQIEEDRKKFHVFMSYKHTFNYSFRAIYEFSIVLSYNNNSIIGAEYRNEEDIFIAENSSSFSETHFWMGIWYINFSQIPYTPNSKSIISLNNVFLVNMYLEYDHSYANVGAEYYEIKQFLCFNSNLHLLFVYIPLTYTLMA